MMEKRARFFLAVEGQSEQSFVKWLQILTAKELHIHLDSYPLGGGGFSVMLSEAVRFHKKGISKGKYRYSFLLVDSDRTEDGDWSVEKLRREAKKHNIAVCLQKPKHEGVLLRMMPGMERRTFDRLSADRELNVLWPRYEKPVDANTLAKRLSLDDLLRMANFDDDMRFLLQKIGLLA